MTMNGAVPTLSLLICAVLAFPADASRISSRLPHHILMNTSLQVVNPPVRMDLLSLRWEYDGRPLVEYKDGNLTLYSPWVVMTLEQLRQGNISLVLTNITTEDAGNYTCVIQYGGVLQTAIYALIIEPNRIRLLNITPPPQKAGVSLVRSSRKSSFPQVNGEMNVTAKPGDNVTLPCLFKMDRAIGLSTLVVHWSKDGVTKYFSNKTCCDLGHDISEEDLQNGRAPLQLLDVQEKDAGVYTCSIKYDTMEESLNTTFYVQGDLPSPEPSTSIRPTTAATATSRRDKSIVPEPVPPYRALKFGLVSGVVAVTGLVAVFVFFCFEG